MMTEQFSQYNEKTYRLLRGLRRTNPEEDPEFIKCPPEPQQKRRKKLVPTYEHPVIAHCIKYGEFLYWQVTGHEIVWLDDDGDTRQQPKSQVTSEHADGARSTRGSGLSEEIPEFQEEYLHYKKYDVYARQRPKKSDTADNGKNTSEPALLKVVPELQDDYSYYKKHDAYQKIISLAESDAVCDQRQGRIEEEAATALKTEEFNQYNDKTYRLLRGLRRTNTQQYTRADSMEDKIEYETQTICCLQSSRKSAQSPKCEKRTTDDLVCIRLFDDNDHDPSFSAKNEAEYASKSTTIGTETKSEDDETDLSTTSLAMHEAEHDISTASVDKEVTYENDDDSDRSTTYLSLLESEHDSSTANVDKTVTYENDDDSVRSTTSFALLEAEHDSSTTNVDKTVTDENDDDSARSTTALSMLEAELDSQNTTVFNEAADEDDDEFMDGVLGVYAGGQLDVEFSSR